MSLRLAYLRWKRRALEAERRRLLAERQWHDYAIEINRRDAATTDVQIASLEFRRRFGVS